MKCQLLDHEIYRTLFLNFFVNQRIFSVILLKMDYFVNVDGRASKKFLTEKRKWLISMLEA